MRACSIGVLRSLTCSLHVLESDLATKVLARVSMQCKFVQKFDSRLAGAGITIISQPSPASL